MTLRRTLPALFASILFAGLATSAVAAPARVHHARPMHHTVAKPMHKVGKKMMPMRAAPRGGDAQNSTIDQLNAQSLQRAQTGAPAN